jgi:hypothetical protein
MEINMICSLKRVGQSVRTRNYPKRYVCFESKTFRKCSADELKDIEKSEEEVHNARLADIEMLYKQSPHHLEILKKRLEKNKFTFPRECISVSRLNVLFQDPLLIGKRRMR